MAAAFSAFGEAVDQRVEGIEQSVSAQDARLAAAEAKVIELETQVRDLYSKIDASSDVKQLESKLADIQEEQKQIKANSPTTSLSSWAVMGCLGWDTAGETLVERAKISLHNAGVKEDQYSFLSATRDPGSMVTLRFVSQQVLDDSILRVRSRKAPAYDSGKAVWLDHALTPEQTRPVKMIHRAHEQIEAVFLSKGIKKKVEKYVRDRRIKVAGHVVISIFKGALKWGPAAKEDLTQDEMDEIMSFAEL